jgi:hypothetical protein
MGTLLVTFQSRSSCSVIKIPTHAICRIAFIN